MISSPSTVRKAAAIIIENGKMLVVRAHHSEIYIAPGGKVDGDESDAQALCRELREELSISVLEESLHSFGIYEALAAGRNPYPLVMHVFLVPQWSGILKPMAEIAELYWLGAKVPLGLSLGSIFRDKVHPELCVRGLLGP